MAHYDGVIIGSGQAGNPLAGALAKAGWQVAVIEREHVGGTCINEGCTPTKTMVASARVAYLTRRSADYGVQFSHRPEISVDMQKVRQRKRDIVASFRGGNERRLKTTEGITLIEGEASFTGPNSLHVRLNNGGTTELTADKFFINTGARPAPAEVPGANDLDTLLTSTSIMELDSLPEHLIVLGGGYIGVEFGQMFRRFGSKVTIIQRSAQLLSREDSDIAAEVAKILEEDGITVLLQTKALRVEQLTPGQIRLTLQTPSGEQVLDGSHLLASGGRVPNTESLHLEKAGVQVDKRGFIVANERLETGVAGIYALGDVKGGPAFTHISYDDFRILRTNLLENGQATTKERLVPYTVFIDPQLGGVGLTEQEAKAQNLNYKVAKMPMSWVARALEMDESRGLMKIIVEAETKQILGCAILGIEGGELMAVVQMAMLGKLPYTVLQDAVFSHPTLAESLNNIFGNLT